MTLQDMTNEQLDRVYRRIYWKYADCFGLDAPTLRIIAPGALKVLEDILKIAEHRGNCMISGQVV